MSCMPAFNAFRRRKSPLDGTFFAPAGLSHVALLHAVAFAARDLVAAHSGAGSAAVLQRANARSLVRKMKLLLSLFDHLIDSPPPQAAVPPATALCFTELYIAVYRARSLLDFCAQTSRLWLLLQNPQASGYFHDLNVEIATLLDVLPLQSLPLPTDVTEQVELLRHQCRQSKLFVDPRDEQLRLQLFSFLDEFSRGQLPELAKLRTAFVDRLGIGHLSSCRAEIEFLEEQIYNQENEADPSILIGVVALSRYCRFVLFGFDEERRSCNDVNDVSAKKLIRGSVGEGSFVAPKDFCCPISLDLMKDPVVTSTGQTYDRASITQWMEEGHSTCPNSGLLLTHTLLVPNHALRSLIYQWCGANGIPYDPPNCFDNSEGFVNTSASKAAIEANKATAVMLVGQLSCGSEDGKAVAAQELRLLAKTGRDNRSCIAEAGAIPHLQLLLHSANPVSQENSVTALLNLSILDQNKSRIMEENGCLSSIVSVLRHGQTVEAKENAAATLFSLSAVHDYKKRITNEPGAVEALAGLLRSGSVRGKKDAVTALFNLSTHADCSQRIVDSGAVIALVEALAEDTVAEDAAGALALLVRRPIVVEAVGEDNAAVMGFMGLMRRGSPRGKENAVAALQEMCRTGGSSLTQRVVRTAGLGGLIQTIMFTGTKRARRKAASLARMCQRFELAAASQFGGGWTMEYALARSGSVRHAAAFVNGDVSVSIPVARSVPVL